MTGIDLQRVEDIFHRAAELEGAELSEYLDSACGQDILLRGEVESLLAHRTTPVAIFELDLADVAFELLGTDCAFELSVLEIGHFSVLSLIGEGGMGEVYLAEDARLGRKVAIKLLPPYATVDRRQAERFEAEARAASALNHPGIVTIHEIGEHKGTRYIAMEFVEGETLRKRMNSGKLPVKEAVGICIQIAGALAAAHRAGIVHRDVKPENVMVRDDGYVKLLDFGIAFLADSHGVVSDFESLCGQANEEPQASGTSITNQPRLGTPAYMSPQQALGHGVDHRTDLYSLGVILYEMLAGRRPFKADSSATLIHALIHYEPDPIASLRPGIPASLAEIVTRLLSKNPDEGYQSAAELLSDLKRLNLQVEMDGSTPHGEALGRLDSSQTPARGARYLFHRLAGRPKTTSLIAAAVLLVLVAAIDFAMGSHVWRVRDSVFVSLAACLASAYFYFRTRVVHSSLERGTGLAFRGLAPFSEADRDFFFGRERELSALLEMIRRDEFRFGVFYGDSGAGKSSLILAGLVPALRDEGFEPIYCRSYEDPTTVLLKECKSLARLDPNEDEDTISYLKRVCAALGRCPVIVFDQFEEFFVNFRRREREPFVNLLAECYRTRDLPVKFILAIRSDFLYLVSSEFDGRIAEPLMGDKRFQLRCFDEDRAREVIERSAEKGNLALETELCRNVARDLAVDDTVLPSELQIVGEQLQRRGIFTLDEYRRAGSKEQLVHTYVGDVVESADDQDTARLVLRSLISDDNTRLTLAAKEIARRTQRSIEAVECALRLFTRAGLVREIQGTQPWRYELIHEYLIAKINEITGKVMDARQRANRLFRQYLSNYSVDKRARIPLSKVLLIRRYSDLDQTGAARTLLRRSLWRGVVTIAAMAIVFIVVAAGAAAYLSIGEEWDVVKLADGHRAAVRRIAFSPDGRRLVSTSEDHDVIVWDFARRVRIATLHAHSDVVAALAYSPDGRWFATGSYDGTVIVWDAATLGKAAVLRDGNEVMALAFSNDSTVLFSQSYMPRARTMVWKVGTWENIHEFPFGVGEASNLLVTSDGWLINGEGIAIRRNQTGWERKDTPIRGVTALSPDGKWAVRCGGKVEFWRLHRPFSPAAIQSFGQLPGHKDDPRGAAFSPDGRLAATGSDDVILWDVLAQKPIAHLECPSIVWNVAFSPDGKWLVSAHGDGSILIWDVADRRLAASLNGHIKPVRSVAFSSDGNRIASGSDDESVIIWNAKTGDKEAVFQEHASRVTAVAYSKAGSLASANYDGSLFILDPGGLRPRRIGPESGFAVYSDALSANGSFVATTRHVFETSSGRIVVDFGTAGFGEDPYGLDFSPAGDLLITATPKDIRQDGPIGIVCLRDTRTWNVIASAPDSTIPVCARFSPDGKWLVIGGDQREVVLWSVNPLRQVAVIGRHEARVKWVTFSPDGNRVASASDDGTIALWDVASRSLITRVGAHSSPVYSISFSPDGRRLVSGEADNSVRVYTNHKVLWGHRLN